VPAAHWPQLDAADALYMPTEQFEQVDWPEVSAKVPAEHSVHALASAAEYLPASQLLHAITS